jgi:D-alanyl-D-alanine carboxypeptidase
MTFHFTRNKRYLVVIVLAFLMTALPFFEKAAYATESEDISEDTEEATTETPQTTEYPEGSGIAPELVSDSAIVIDADTGDILYEKDAYSTRYPASITKIMTGLLALENGDLTSTVTFSENAIWGIERDSTHIALDVGEELTLEQALYATLVVSANEAAMGVAEHIAGSIESFADMMNEKAAELGCVNTHFVNPNGLHDDDHYTCAYDMALIARAAIQIDKFREITSTTYYEIPPTNLQTESRYLYQNNKLIMEGSAYYYEPCIGGKTGFTDQALGTLVTWAEQDGRTLICVVMHTRPTSCTYTDATALFKYCFSSSPEPVGNVDDINKNEDADETLDSVTETATVSDMESPENTESEYAVSTDTVSSDEDTTKFKISKRLIIISVILIAMLCLALRIKYVRRKRAEYIARRDLARNRGKHF